MSVVTPKLTPLQQRTAQALKNAGSCRFPEEVAQRTWGAMTTSQVRRCLKALYKKGLVSKHAVGHRTAYTWKWTLRS